MKNRFEYIKPNEPAKKGMGCFTAFIISFAITAFMFYLWVRN